MVDLLKYWYSKEFINEAYLTNLVSKGRISLEEKQSIMES